MIIVLRRNFCFRPNLTIKQNSRVQMLWITTEEKFICKFKFNTFLISCIGTQQKKNILTENSFHLQIFPHTKKKLNWRRWCLTTERKKMGHDNTPNHLKWRNKGFFTLCPKPRPFYVRRSTGEFSINKSPCMHENRFLFCRLVLFNVVISSSNINGVSKQRQHMSLRMRVKYVYQRNRLCINDRAKWFV